MQSMQLVLAKDNKKELRERRHQTRDDSAHEEGVEGAPLVLRSGGAEPERSLPHLVNLRRRHLAHEGEILLRYVGGD